MNYKILWYAKNKSIKFYKKCYFISNLLLLTDKSVNKFSLWWTSNVGKDLTINIVLKA